MLWLWIEEYLTECFPPFVSSCQGNERIMIQNHLKVCVVPTEQQGFFSQQDTHPLV